MKVVVVNILTFEFTSCLLPAAHMPAQAWVGLNDINVENQFVYTDGTPAVRDEAVNILCDAYNCKMILV